MMKVKLIKADRISLSEFEIFKGNISKYIYENNNNTVHYFQFY